MPYWIIQVRAAHKTNGQTDRSRVSRWLETLARGNSQPCDARLSLDGSKVVVESDAAPDVPPGLMQGPLTADECRAYLSANAAQWEAAI